MFKPCFSAVKFILILIGICSCSAVFAQQEFLLNGVIFQKQNNQRVVNAIISNKNNKITAASDNLGGFSIKASIGDTLKVVKPNYTEYFYTVSTQKDVVI